MVDTGPASSPKDKREHPRFKVEGATTVVGKPGFLASLGIGPIRHSIVNLSQGGAMVRVGKSLPIGSRHELEIEIPNAKEVIQTVGEIRWCAQSARKASDFYVGFRFVDLSPAERNKLGGMSERFAAPKDPSRKDPSGVQLKPPSV
ncbi:MAG TPA: PilZ domain-containing protein [Planctomycetota bacterium]|nr:PilZ domain-containing protein [Planctomycetota bacterium]